MENTIILMIKDGVVSLIKKPEEIIIIIRDYDVSDENTVTDENGNECYEYTL